MRSTTSTGVGEIVEVQGGHIVRSTGRKDRHSKVCTAKGPRDRRVRLSAHTAIQFYDVQDRLGYDRPSKAVDWLIKKAKAAIDQLAELPAWNPTAIMEQQQQQQQQQQINEIFHRDTPAAEDGLITGSSCRNVSGRMSEEFQQQQFVDENNNNDNNNDNNSNKYNSAGSGFLPPSMDTDITDTIKSFFPMVAAAETTTSFNNYSTPPDLLSRTTSTAANHNHQQDLRLSLHSFQDPILFHHHQQQQNQNQTQNQNQQVLFNGINTLGFDGGGSSGWLEQHHQHEQEHGRFHRMVAWNAAAADDSHSGGGFVFNSPPPSTVAPAAMFGHHGQYFSQRGPLQSSNTPSIRAWIDSNSLAAAATVAAVSHPHYHHHYLSPSIHQASATGFASPYGGFPGFRIPARIQGEEEHDGVSDKPSSASSDSRH